MAEFDPTLNDRFVKDRRTETSREYASAWVKPDVRARGVPNGRKATRSRFDQRNLTGR